MRLRGVVVGAVAMAAALGSACAQAANSGVLHDGAVPSRSTVFRVVDEAGAPQSFLMSVEDAVEYQTAHDLDPVWHTGAATFGAAGIPVYIRSVAETATDCGPQSFGCHNLNEIFVPWDGVPSHLSYITSHEIVETLVDLTLPTTADEEVCDPVDWQSYAEGAVDVAEFVSPSYFAPHARAARRRLRESPGYLVVGEQVRVPRDVHSDRTGR